MNAHVLLVEDEPDLCALIAQLLEAELGCTVATAHDGSGALRLATTQVPDLAILDAHFPPHSWQGLVGELTRRNITPPLIVLTGASLTPYAPGVPPVLGFLKKPFPLKDLLRLVRFALERCGGKGGFERLTDD